MKQRLKISLCYLVNCVSSQVKVCTPLINVSQLMRRFPSFKRSLLFACISSSFPTVIHIRFDTVSSVHVQINYNFFNKLFAVTQFVELGYKDLHGLILYKSIYVWRDQPDVFLSLKKKDFSSTIYRLLSDIDYSTDINQSYSTTFGILSLLSSSSTLFSPSLFP